MNKLSGYRTHAVALFVLLLIAVFYGLPEFSGKELRPHDHEMYLGGAWDLISHEQETGEQDLWVRSMFGGMPAYLLHFRPDNNFVGPYVQWALALGLPRIAMYLWIGMAGFYLMGLAFRMRPEAATAGAAAFGLTSYIAVVLAAGHYGKVLAIMYMPWVLAGLALLMHRKYGWGLVVTTLMMSCEIMAGHYQMTYYYFMFVVAFIGIAWAVKQLKEKEVKSVLFTGILAAFALGAGVLTNMNKILPVQEYQPYSTRAVSELTATKDPANETGGLPRDYITGYSYATGDFMALAIPNFKGPGNGPLSNNKAAKSAVKKSADREMLSYFDAYWGGQDAAGGVIYAGVLVAIMALMALFTVNHWLVLPLALGTLLTMLLSLGKNMPGLTDLFIDHFPGYNKFRAVNSIMVIPQFTLPFLFALQMHQMLSDADFWTRPMRLFGQKIKTNWSNQKAHLVLGGGVLSLFALMWLAPALFQEFIRDEEVDMLTKANRSDLVAVVETARMAIFRADALLSFIFAALGLGLVFAWMRGKMQPMAFAAGIVALVVVDLMWVSRRYLAEEKYEKLEACERENLGILGWKVAARLDYMPCSGRKPSPADDMITQLAEPGYRVLNLSVSTFNDATTSFFHPSVGGYHGAKMKRYQEFIEARLQKDISTMVDRVQNPGPDGIDLASVFKGLAGLNMMNTRFVIADPKSNPIPNYQAYGPGWLVDTIQWVNSADEELAAVSSLEDLRSVAVIDRTFESELGAVATGKDSTASLVLKSLTPDEVVYTSAAAKEGVAVFSEIYYPKGWEVTIDGTPAPHFRANYVLRGLKVPAGVHEIAFTFAPTSVPKGAKMSLYGSLLSALLVGFGLFLGWKKWGEEQPKVLHS